MVGETLEQATLTVVWETLEQAALTVDGKALEQAALSVGFGKRTGNAQGCLGKRWNRQRSVLGNLSARKGQAAFCMV